MGTTMAMKVSGSAKSSPRSDGSCAPISTPASVASCQPDHRPRPEPNRIQCAVDRLRRTRPGCHQVRDRGRVGFVGQQIGEEDFPASRQMRQDRRHRRAVEGMAQIHQAHRAGGQQERRAGADQLRQQELRRAGEDDGRHGHRRQRRDAALQRDHAVDHAERGDAHQDRQHGAKTQGEGNARRHLRTGTLTRTMPPTTSAAAKKKPGLGRSPISSMPNQTPNSGVRKENTSRRPAR